MNRLQAYLIELRAPFLTVSILPVVLAAAIARSDTHSWDPLLFWLTLAGAVLLHLGSNTINDWFDHRSGNDEVNVEFVSPFTGGSRMIQAGFVTPRGVLTLSIVLFALAMFIGIYLYTVRGPAIILFGITGLVLGILYTEPRAMLAGRGLGEIAIFLAFRRSVLRTDRIHIDSHTGRASAARCAHHVDHHRQRVPGRNRRRGYRQEYPDRKARSEERRSPPCDRHAVGVHPDYRRSRRRPDAALDAPGPRHTPRGAESDPGHGKDT